MSPRVPPAHLGLGPSVRIADLGAGTNGADGSDGAGPEAREQLLAELRRGRPHEDLRDWLRNVDAIGELRLLEGVDREESIGRITEMLQHTDGAPAVLFDRIPGYEPGWRVLVNAQSERRRLAVTLGLPYDIGTWDLIDRWEQAMDRTDPLPPDFVDSGPVAEHVLEGDAIDLGRFPTPLWHADDGGPYLGTGDAVLTRDPDTGWLNMGTYRVQVHGPARTGLYISPGKHGRIHRDKHFERGEALPAVVLVGMDPLLFVASALEMAPGLSELEWVGGMRGRPVECITGRHTGLPIPARAEIALEGVLRPDVRHPEGPFGEWTGYYASGTREEPVFEVRAVYHRTDPIVLGVPPQKPPYEAHRFRQYLRSANLRREVRLAGVPDVVAAWCHGVGGCRLFNVVAIKQRYPGHARQAGHVAAQCRTGAYLGRITVVVDEDIDVSDLDEVVWAICTRSDPVRSFDIISRAWSGPLDPAIPPAAKGFNSRVIIDATRPLEWRDEFPAAIGPSPEEKRRTRETWGWILDGQGSGA
ncbi:MAG: UbiD family decarboxylase [Candidatus Dormibacteraeota bacterium]|nr:UbiD family decarboxylase [Candidatus Dormibacteraeota bacterium]MBO0760314.1 UbiD family decarboxylase [Candidatus Dormibacteraeota bacterium]